MKKVEANRYPHSATLFKFCKEALEIRYEGNVKVIDQDVGAILGYDPADCSHWKKGKKNIRALGTLRSIANHLNIDERLLIDIAAGRIDLEEAVFEYRGYGSFSIGAKSIESLRKEYFKNPSRWQANGTMRSFEELFDVNRPMIAKAAEALIVQGNVKEAPVYIPELLSQVPSIRIVQDEALDKPFQVAIEGEGAGTVTTISVKSLEMRPYLRFQVVKELFRHMTRITWGPLTSAKEVPEEVIEIQANIFAGMILVPARLLKAEVEAIDSSLDIVTQLADTFWTSKALLNQRLRDYLEHLS
jgi:hypothetical protein